MYDEVSEREFRVIDRIGTRAAAVPAAMTSLNEGSSSYLICKIFEVSIDLNKVPGRNLA